MARLMQMKRKNDWNPQNLSLATSESAGSCTMKILLVHKITFSIVGKCQKLFYGRKVFRESKLF